MRRTAELRWVDVGTRQRLIHRSAALVGLVGFAAAGLLGAALYIGTVLLFHLRASQPHAQSLMDVLLERHELDELVRWRRFAAGSERRVLSVAGWRPHRFVSAACVIALGVLVAVLGALTTELSETVATGARILIRGRDARMARVLRRVAPASGHHRSGRRRAGPDRRTRPRVHEATRRRARGARDAEALALRRLRSGVRTGPDRSRSPGRSRSRPPR